MADYRSPTANAAMLIRTTLYANLTDAEKAEITGSVLGLTKFKCFWNIVPQGVDWPYIRMSHMIGGAENKSKMWLHDVWMRVVIHHGTHAGATDMNDAIYSALVDQWLISLDDDVVCYAPTEHRFDILDNQEMMGTQVYIQGGIYRLRFQEITSP